MAELSRTDRLLAALQGKRYYDYRFAKQAAQLFPQSTGGDGMEVKLFVSELMNVVPAAQRNATAERLIRFVVTECAECPTIDQFRRAVADAALAELGETFASLYERAKHFLATPPTNPEIAARWLEKVIWTAVRKIGRERFATVAADDWQQAVTRAVLRDEGGPLVAYPVKTEVAPQTAKRDFRSLLSRP
ncbi:hypothetical protein [Cupriavidus sp. TMH.W2]|uniref:hypothetical protein n=1 Tax=Cupriavidus sp. TMH.W2 TaxID=3434465 RepID=UPI003D77B5BD